MASRPYSPYAVDAALLLGERVRAARLGRHWSQEDLAGRAGVTANTLRKVERGDPSVALGTAFEVAALLNVSLFYNDSSRVTLELDRVAARNALLPRHARAGSRAVDDDF